MTYVMFDRLSEAINIKINHLNTKRIRITRLYLLQRDYGSYNVRIWRRGGGVYGSGGGRGGRYDEAGADEV